MRVDVTKGRLIEAADLRTSAEVAPSLALPWIVRLRYGVLGGQTALILFTRFALGVELPLEWLAVPLALSAASNRLVYTLARRIGDRRALGYLLAFDTLLLTLLLALTGGPANPLTLLYLVQICLSAVVLSKSWTWALGVASTLGFGLLFVWHVTVPVLEAHHHGGGFSIHLGGMWVCFAAATLLISISIGRVSDALRLREQEVLFLQDRIARQEKLASLVTLAAGAAHELGSPLATIAVVSKDLELVARDAELAADARLIRAEVERCRAILQRMSSRGAAQPGGEAPARVRLSDLLSHVRGEMPEAERTRIRVETAAAPASVRLPPDATRQALAALVRNALDASRDRQEVVLAAGENSGWLEFTVRDSGRGMSAETLRRIAEPFYTTKAAGAGMGLGTYLVRVFAEHLGGGLSFDSEPGLGTKAVLVLPLTQNGT